MSVYRALGGNELSGEDAGNEYLATRAGSGAWTQSNLAPTGAPSSIFQAFSADLTVGFLDAVEPLSANAPGYGETVPLNRNYDDLYATDTSGHEYTPFFTGKPPYRSVNTFQTAGGEVSIKHEVKGYRGHDERWSHRRADAFAFAAPRPTRSTSRALAKTTR